MSQNAALTFLPWLKLGANAREDTAPLTGGHRVVGMNLMVLKEGNPVLPYTKDVALKGPGDILGFTAQMVARAEPSSNENSFEPNYFPFVEFTDPDLPWRYSLEKDADGHVTPWLALIILKRGLEFESSGVSSQNLPLIKVTAPVLPDLGQLWAWAHVQLAGGIRDAAGNAIKPSNTTNYTAEVLQYIKNKPALTCSRLMCPRRLEKLTLYTAFLVPAYKAGAMAGRGETPEDVKDKAWTEGEADVVLPVYYSWDFQTTENGDFEELLDRLNYGGEFDDVGMSPIDGSRPGYITGGPGQPQSLQNTEFYIEGALAPVGYVSSGRNTLPNVEFAAYTIDGLRKSLDDSMVLNGKGGEDLLVALPVYGKYYPENPSIVPPDNSGRWAGGAWLSELNMDVAYRSAAALGTGIVQENQEGFVRECWEQVGDVKEANERLRIAYAGRVIGENIDERHVSTFENHRYALITEPFQGQYVCERKSGEKSFRKAFKESGLPAGSVSYPFRRILNTKLGYDKVTKDQFFKPWSANPNGHVDERVEDLDTSVYRRIAGELLVKDLDKETQQRYFQLFDAWTTGVLPLKPEIITVDPVDIGEGDPPGKGSLRDQVDIGVSILQRMTATIDIPGTKLQNLHPILWHPSINIPMSKYLIGKSLDVLVPNISKVEKNTVVLFEQNNKFIEAYMAGLNHEINRELVWRGFPTDGRGTVFTLFWDAYNYRAFEADIKDMKAWDKPLGSNSPRQHGGSSAVFAIKADLFKRYPNTIFYALRVNKKDPRVSFDPVKQEYNPPWEYIFDKINQMTDSTAPNPDAGLFAVIEPIWSVHASVDTLFMFFPFKGDDVKNDPNNLYYFILSQHTSLPRFGLDEERDKQNESLLDTWDNLAWNDVTPSDRSGWLDISKIEGDLLDKNNSVKAANQGIDFPGPVWGADAASAAWITYQKPVRIIVDALDLIG